MKVVHVLQALIHKVIYMSKLRHVLSVLREQSAKERRLLLTQARLENLWELKEKDITERKQMLRMDILKSLLGKTGELSEKE